MLSSTLAELYEVEVCALIQATKRNLDRFPEDFMFKLNPEEVEALRSQNVILELKGKGRYPKYPPYAFTQEGVAMLASVLLSPRAIQANIAIMRAFVKLRELMDSHRELSQKIEALEKRYDSQFKVIFKSIQELIKAKPNELVHIPKKNKLGFG